MLRNFSKIVEKLLYLNIRSFFC